MVRQSVRHSSAPAQAPMSRPCTFALAASRPLSVTALGAGGAVIAAPARPRCSAACWTSARSSPTPARRSAPPSTASSWAPGALITGVTGTVGGVVGGVESSVTGVLDQTLGGVLGGTSSALPDTVLDNLLGTLLAASSGVPGATGSGGPNVLSGGSVTPGGIVIDASAPRPTVKVLSKLKAIGSNGRMRLEIRTNGPASSPSPAASARRGHQEVRQVGQEALAQAHQGPVDRARLPPGRQASSPSSSPRRPARPRHIQGRAHVGRHRRLGPLQEPGLRQHQAQAQAIGHR